MRGTDALAHFIYLFILSDALFPWISVAVVRFCSDFKKRKEKPFNWFKRPWQNQKKSAPHAVPDMFSGQ